MLKPGRSTVVGVRGVHALLLGLVDRRCAVVSGGKEGTNEKRKERGGAKTKNKLHTRSQGEQQRLEAEQQNSLDRALPLSLYQNTKPLVIARPPSSATSREVRVASGWCAFLAWLGQHLHRGKRVKYVL